MPIDLVGRTTMANQLKASLDVSVQRTRAIADRVAQATARQQGFTLPDVGAGPGSQGQGPVDVETEMVSLADEQLRFEATAKLLKDTYAGMKDALKG
jgi:flagellar basal body rod protein FlgB